MTGDKADFSARGGREYRIRSQAELCPRERCLTAHEAFSRPGTTHRAVRDTPRSCGVRFGPVPDPGGPVSRDVHVIRSTGEVRPEGNRRSGRTGQVVGVPEDPPNVEDLRLQLRLVEHEAPAGV